jgi:hypothetical protein
VIDGAPYRVRRENGADVNARIDQAFRDKYGARSPGSTDAMLRPEVAATTLRLSD